MHFKIKKGLKIPIDGEPSGPLRSLPSPSYLALDLDPFFFLRFTLLKKEGDTVRIGEALAHDKEMPSRVFVSPASGTIQEIVRGLKRRLLHIVIKTDAEPKWIEYSPLNEEKLLLNIMERGLSPHIRVRPCNQLPHLKKMPDAIFIKALNSAPFAPPPELEIELYPKEFQQGLTLLSALAPVHLVYAAATSCQALLQATAVEKHTAEGPYPISSPSVPIAAIFPIQTRKQVVWTLTAHDVIAIGYMHMRGRYYTDRVISLAGPGVPKEKRGFYKGQRGYPIASLFSSEPKVSTRYLSGDPLMGSEVTTKDFMKFFDTTFCALPDPIQKRRFSHFMRFKTRSFTTTWTYFRSKKEPRFSTLQHGEERAFIDGQIYDRVMPLKVPTMQLVKALLAEDYPLAEALGLLTVAPEDFALPAFICPSKIPMPDIVKQGQAAYAKLYLDD